MYRYILILTSLLLTAIPAMTQDSEPIVEIQADRTVIYPQRMELTGEETLMDLLQMVPELMIEGYEDVITNYNLRLDNCPMNGSNRLILSQTKARDIAMIQVCTNTGVAKGSVGMARVLDINLVMPDSLAGFAEGQGGFGKDIEGNATVNTRYGSRHTDLYANATYRYTGGHRDYVTLHMTNRFDAKNRLLTYFTQEYAEQPSGGARKLLGRARYFHTFNDRGTQLLVVGSYQYNSDDVLRNKLPMYNTELSTPLGRWLKLAVGIESDFVMTEQKHTDKSWDVCNHDVYAQLTCNVGRWSFAAGERAMFYRYNLKNDVSRRKYSETRHNANASVIFKPNSRHQLQAGYFRSYFNPVYNILFKDAVTFSDEEWAFTEGHLADLDINQFKLAYAYTRRTLTVNAEASNYIIEGVENLTNLTTSVYWKTRWLSLTGGVDFFFTPSEMYGAVRCAPTAWLPRSWQIGLQLVYYTPEAPQRKQTGVPVYGCLSVSKVFAKRWYVGAEWHDMADIMCSNASVNRNAANIRLQYRF